MHKCGELLGVSFPTVTQTAPFHTGIAMFVNHNELGGFISVHMKHCVQLMLGYLGEWLPYAVIEFTR